MGMFEKTWRVALVKGSTLFISPYQETYLLDRDMPSESTSPEMSVTKRYSYNSGPLHIVFVVLSIYLSTFCLIVDEPRARRSAGPSPHQSRPNPGTRCSWTGPGVRGQSYPSAAATAAKGEDGT